MDPNSKMADFIEEHSTGSHHSYNPRNDDHAMRKENYWNPEDRSQSYRMERPLTKQGSWDSQNRFKDISRSLNRRASDMDLPLANGRSKSIHKGTPKMHNNYRNDHRGYSDHRKIRLRREPKKKDCVSYLTGVLHCYNVFLLILGAGVLACGVWLLVKDYNSREISAVVGSRMFEYLTYGLTAGGGAVAILAFCGCCGTMRQDRFVLGFYGTVLTIVFMLLCAGFALGIIFRDTLKEDLTEHFKVTLISKYGVDTDKITENRLITDAWDAMQRTLQCCGAIGQEDSLFSWAIYKLQSDWYNKEMRGKTNRPLVPESCCVTGKSKHDCQGIGKIDGIPVKGPPLDYVNDMNDALNKRGCYDRAIDYVKNHSLYITVVAGAVPLLLIVGMIISFYLCSKSKTDDDDSDDEEEEADV